MVARTLDEDTEGEAEAAPEASKSLLGGRRKLLIFAAAGLLLTGGTGGVLYYTGLVNKLLGSHKPGDTAEAAAPPPKPSVFFDLQDLLVNLNSNGRKAISLCRAQDTVT